VNDEYTPLLKQRFERKFLIHPFSRSQAELIIRLHPAVFSPIFKTRRVNNLYLDTTQMAFFHDNVQGNSQRIKYRIRWYGKLLGEIQYPVMEIKIKNGYVGRKFSIPLDPFKIDTGFQAVQWKEKLKEASLPLWLVHDLKDLQPTLLNSYQRSYYLSHDRRFRITVDDQMDYYEVFPWENEFIRNRFISNEVVVELKYDIDQDDWADQITNHFPFRMMKNSKYINGILHFNPQVAL
jgi:SPX domain protein involved in polyphosphate accumulation